ncbi:hypothetical protein ACQPZQ_16175 [Pseudonocardia sp. CA-142604]|uniref:hypothetical protein n=1 Tax=Pseudonocardia sp. CA-142604 TaxID=3240024 RepID=UPI003D8E5D79
MGFAAVVLSRWARSAGGESDRLTQSSSLDPPPGDPLSAPLSDGLLLLRGDARFRSARGVSDDRHDVYLLCEVGDSDPSPSAYAVVRRTGDHAVLSSLTGPADLLARLVREICDTLRADAVRTLSAGPDLPHEVAALAGVSRPVSL